LLSAATHTSPARAKEAANERGQAGGLKSRFHVATPDWQGVTGWHGLLVGGRTVDPNQWSAESPASFCQRTGIAASFSARAALLGDAKVSRGGGVVKSSARLGTGFSAFKRRC
jgi:hypothetical protein